MEESELKVSTDTNTEIKIESEKNKGEFLDFVEKQTNILVYKGVLLGLHESLKALNMFLDEKVKDGKQDFMSRHELNLFMQTYIGEYQSGIKVCEENNNLKK